MFCKPTAEKQERKFVHYAAYQIGNKVNLAYGFNDPSAVFPAVQNDKASFRNLPRINRD